MTWGFGKPIALSPAKAARLAYGVAAVALGGGFGLQSAQAQVCVITSFRIAMTSGVCTVAPGADLRAGSLAPAVSATNLGTVIDLTPGATVTTGNTKHAIDMINGGVVLIGPDTLVQVNAASTGVLGVSITNTTVNLGPGIRIDLHNTTAGTDVSGYGLRAIRNSVVTLGLTLTSDFSKSAYGVRADTASAVTLTNGSTLRLGGSEAAPGGAVLMAVDPVSVIDARNSTRLSNSGYDVTGAYMSNGGLVLMDSSTTLSLENVALADRGSAGVVVDNTVVPEGTIDGVSMQFAGMSGTGVTATRGGQITMRDISIQGAGIGVIADTLSSVAISDSSISISDSHGGLVRTIEPSGATFVTTPVRQSAGLVALGGVLDADGVSVAVAADGAYGVHATFSIASPATAGTLTFAKGEISTSGLGSHGAVATGSPFVTDTPTLQLSNATVTTSGESAHGLATINGGAINATGSTIQADGIGSYGLFSSTTSLTRQNNVSISGGSLASTRSTAIQVSGSQLNLSLSNSVEVAGGNGMLFQVASVGARAGTLNLAANAANMTGAALTDVGSNSNMSLANNSLWHMTGSSNVSRLVNAFSMIDFSAPSGAPTLLPSYKTLVVGNYEGEGGVIGLNTFLGADGSPSDRLVIDGGRATGLTSLRITRSGGPGALTLGNGIQVVETIGGGTTSADAFTLSQRVVEGPYEYLLFRSSLDASNAEAWYLRSERPIVPPDPEVVPPAPPPSPPPLPDPEVDPPRPIPPLDVPLYRPEVGAYLANQRMANSLFVHSLIDRLGEPQGLDAPNRARRSAWLRLEARRGGSTSRDGNFDADIDSTLIQGGGEIARWSVGGERGRLNLGGMLGYGRARSDAAAAGNTARARGETEGWNVGGYGTWYQNDQSKLGWYADVWAAYRQRRRRAGFQSGGARGSISKGSLRGEGGPQRAVRARLDRLG
jgi:autotransporter family porin